MEENNVVVVDEEQPKKKKSSNGGFKEWRRKQVISLKRKPQNIAFLFVLVTTIYNLLCLETYSKAIRQSGAGSGVDWVGLMLFVNTLFSLLVVVTFMNSFPKLKKYGSKTVKTINFTQASKININLVMACVYFAFSIIMIVCECIYCSKMADFKATSLSGSASATEAAMVQSTITLSIVHIVLVAVDIVMALLVPVFGKLLAKIDTSKELESAVANMQEIDLASED